MVGGGAVGHFTLTYQDIHRVLEEVEAIIQGHSSWETGTTLVITRRIGYVYKKGVLSL